MSVYKVKSNLNHNGRGYKKGDEVELNDEAAAQLIKDGIVANPKEKDDEDDKKETQPSVNNVSREGGDVDGEAKVEAGAKNEPTKDDDDEDDEEENKNDAPKSEYKVLKELEYPQGTVHEVDEVLALTEVEAGKFDEGLLEKVEDNL